jgi:hypothetical protein
MFDSASDETFVDIVGEEVEEIKQKDSTIRTNNRSINYSPLEHLEMI